MTAVEGMADKLLVNDEFLILCGAFIKSALPKNSTYGAE
jgi:hypothetical protein